MKSIYLITFLFLGLETSQFANAGTTLSVKQRTRRSARLDLSWTRNQQYGIVFVYSRNFFPQEVYKIESAAKEILKYSCINVNVYSEEKYLNSGGSVNRFFQNIVFITKFSWKGCFADIGMQGGIQKMNLDPLEGCTLKKATILHEMIHSLGFDHEHNRPDRNQFVTINFENVAPGKENNFKIKPYMQAVGPYDYYSIMHYGSTAFSINNYPTISSKVNGYRVFPLASPELSPIDKQKIQYITGCNKAAF